MFFSDGYSMLRILAVGVCAYVGLIALLRLYGKRSLSQFNAFDFVVTVALGSTLATMLLSKQTALADGLLAFVVLLSLQFALTWSAVRSEAVDRLVKSDPRLLVYRGTFLSEALRRERVAEHEVRNAVRNHGLARMDQVEAVVLETDGRISVLSGESAGAGRAEGRTGVAAGKHARRGLTRT